MVSTKIFLCSFISSSLSYDKHTSRPVSNVQRYFLQRRKESKHMVASLSCTLWHLVSDHGMEYALSCEVEDPGFSQCCTHSMLGLYDCCSVHDPACSVHDVFLSLSERGHHLSLDISFFFYLLESAYLMLM